MHWGLVLGKASFIKTTSTTPEICFCATQFIQIKATGTFHVQCFSPGNHTDFSFELVLPIKPHGKPNMEREYLIKTVFSFHTSSFWEFVCVTFDEWNEPKTVWNIGFSHSNRCCTLTFALLWPMSNDIFRISTYWLTQTICYSWP